MAQDHRLQQQRFELKYLIPEEITRELRSFIRAYLELDDYGANKPNLAYPVHSLYLDSPGLETHYAGINGTKNRYKLRLRYYDDHEDSPVFFEIKRRVDNCILKQRCGVKREAVALLLSGELPDSSHLISREPRHLGSLQRFNLLMHHINARPKLHNHYQREAWVSPENNSIRVTFDRFIRCEPFFRPEAVVPMTKPIQVFPESVVLELKYTNRFPGWFREMVERFDLMQFSSAKYCEGVERIGVHRFCSEDACLQRWRATEKPAFWTEAAAGFLGLKHA